MIAGSMSLSSAEARTMVVMSDLSGAGVRPGPSGYLTGYPLDGSGRYVLARTWAAPEMPRPGCVWTHSLIVENTDLATLTSSDDLLAAFRRPSKLDSKEGYAAPIELPAGPLRPPKVRGHRARTILNAVYAASTQQVIAIAEDTAEDEDLLFAIWMQQWPRLRRTFGFCTLAGMDRSSKGVRLDVQLVPDLDRSARSRFPGAVLPQDIECENALAVLVRDLEGLDETKLREFLRRAGGDVDGGRQAMLPLCRLHSALFSGDRPDLIAAIDALDGLGKSQARSVRSMVVKYAIEEIDQLDEKVFDFVVEAMKEGAVSRDAHVSVNAFTSLWRRSPSRFFTIIDAKVDLTEQLMDLLLSMTAEDLILGLESNPELSSRVASVRPDLMESADFWRGKQADLDLLERIGDDQVPLVVPALIEAGIEAAPSIMISRMNSGTLASIIGRISGPLLEVWLRELASDPDRVATVLSSGGISRREVLVALAKFLNPDSVPNELGEDPWVMATRGARGRLDQIEEDFFSAFLMSRALGPSSRSRSELVHQSYEAVYRALERGRLPWEAERLVTDRLNWGGLFGWSNCSRLRDTVVDLFVSNHLDPGVFGRLADEGRLALSLIDEAARSPRGRRYLDEVRSALKDAQEKAFRARADYISKKLN